jgi:hypothetical protein
VVFTVLSVQVLEAICQEDFVYAQKIALGHDDEGVFTQLVYGSFDESAGSFGGNSEFLSNLAIAVTFAIYQSKTSSYGKLSPGIKTIKKASDHLFPVIF